MQLYVGRTVDAVLWRSMDSNIIALILDSVVNQHRTNLGPVYVLINCNLQSNMTSKVGLKLADVRLSCLHYSWSTWHLAELSLCSTTVWEPKVQRSDKDAYSIALVHPSIFLDVVGMYHLFSAAARKIIASH